MTDAPKIPRKSDVANEDKSHRPILTFMRRTSPLNTSQQQGLMDYSHLIVPAPIQDARLIFENPTRPLTIEIGFGMGSSLVMMAKAAPERNFLGIEVHLPGIAQCAFEAGQAGITNLRIMDADALEVLAGIPDGSVDRVQLFFPDPWQKKRHFKRRFVAPERMALIVRKLTQGGWFHAATDWQPYAEWMIDVLEQVTELDNLYGKGLYAPRPDWRPQTKFERRGEAAGHGVWDVIYQRV
jgi:tRNA (guanine-N7-)-methyltransferase